MIPIGKVAAVFRDIAHEALLSRGNAEQAIAKRRDAVAARLACHASIRSGDAINRDEVYALLKPSMKLRVVASAHMGDLF